MKSKWKTKPLGDITSYLAKGIPPKYTEEETENTILVLNQKCNRDFRISYDNVRFHDNLLKAVPETKMLIPGDVLINSTGAGTAGRVAQIWHISKPTTIDGHMILMRPTDEIDTLYYGYAIKAQQKAIESYAEGSTGQTEINKSRLQNETFINFPVNKSKQYKIGRFLADLDDKIELNNAINRNLEQQAQALFKSWFIDFEPFGGEMPEDWKNGELCEIAEIIMGQSPKGSTYNEKGQGKIFFQGRGEFGFRFPTKRLFTTEPKRMAQADDVLLSVRAPVGDINIAFEDCCIGRGLGTLHSRNSCKSFLFYLMQYQKSQLDTFNGEGTVFGSINRDSLKALSLNIPSELYMKKFEDIVHPMDAMIRKNFDENNKLSSLRDSLLPRLIGGEIDVSDL